MATHQLVTAEELERMGSRNGDYELVRGVLVPVTPPGPDHGELAAYLSAQLVAFTRPRRLGTVYVESGYVLFRGPDTVRGPDVSFLSPERAAQVKGRRGFVPFAPDLAVEVRSPDDSPADLSAKAQDYLDAGARLVWVVDPPARTVQVREPGRAPRVLGIDAVLDGGEVLPGFALPLAELFGEE
jgi:Uma2 family endonuclease